MAKIKVTQYTIDTTENTITFDGYDTIDALNIKSIYNVTRGELLYDGGENLSGTAADNVLTLDVVFPFMSNTDTLEIIMDDMILLDEYTLSNSDAGKYLRISNDGAIDLVVDAGVFEIGQSVTVEQAGQGIITVVGVDQTVNGVNTTGAQYKTIELVRTDDTTWTVIGGIAGD